MLEQVRKVAATHSLDVSESADALAVRVAKGDVTFELLVPATVLEWYASGRSSSGVEIWKDWVDYYSLKSESEAQLREDMLCDLERCIAALARSDVRVTDGVLEWNVDGEWRPLSVASV